jgi:hypothetical protein
LSVLRWRRDALMCVSVSARHRHKSALSPRVCGYILSEREQQSTKRAPRVWPRCNHVLSRALIWLHQHAPRVLKSPSQALSLFRLYGARRRREADVFRCRQHTHTASQKQRRSNIDARVLVLIMVEGLLCMLFIGNPHKDQNFF